MYLESRIPYKVYDVAHTSMVLNKDFQREPV